MLDAALIRRTRHVRPTTADALWNWTFLHTGVRLARNAVCCGHHAPFDYLAACQLDRPKVSLCIGSRGSGKSFITAIDTHQDSRFLPYHGTRILGGSQAQAKQIHAGIAEAILNGVGPPPFRSCDKDSIEKFGVEKATYRNGSEVEILTASPLSVRGPHVPSLRMDEVDEILPEIREQAMGMCMAKRGVPAKLTMTSTWHRVGGPVTELIDRAREFAWPFFTFCAFEVLERCPESRSGPYVGGDDLYANCPACPLKAWCHAERDRNGDRAKAKIADGHYALESLIQKAESVSKRVLEADYFCKGPKADGLWFTDFDEARHVSDEADYKPHLPVYFGLDTGVRTGGVWLQIEPFVNRRTGARDSRVNIFADYYGERMTPEMHVRGVHGIPDAPEHKGILEIARERCNGNVYRSWTDPAGKSYNAVGTVALGEYEAAGLHLDSWPKVGVTDALGLVESLLLTADGTVRLRVHPRCRHVIDAFRSYRRAKTKGIYIDKPEEPQHPQENLIDPIKNTLVAVIGIEGHRPQPQFSRVHYTGVI